MAKHAEVVVLCQKKFDEVDPSIRQLEVLRHPTSYFSSGLVALFDAVRIRRIIKQEMKEDTYVHMTVEAYGMFAPFIKSLNVKILMTTHGTFSVLPLKRWKTRWLYKRMYRALDRVIAVSNYTKKHLLKNAEGSITDEKIHVVLNGVDFQERPKRETDDVFRILTVGGVKHRKGGHHLVRIAHHLKEQYNFPFKITFVGEVQKDHSYYKGLEEFIREKNLQDVIHFAGMISQEELDAYYQHANLFALLSVHEHGHYEGYPLVFHEAAMWGLPSIGTFDCGAEDAIKDGETGVLVHPDQHENVASIIADIQSGKMQIDSSTCKNWAQQNDWNNKDLQGMYVF